MPLAFFLLHLTMSAIIIIAVFVSFFSAPHAFVARLPQQQSTKKQRQQQHQQQHSEKAHTCTQAFFVVVCSLRWLKYFNARFSFIRRFMYYFCFGVGFGFSVFLVCMVLVRHYFFFCSFIVVVVFFSFSFFLNIVWFILLANQCKSFYYNVWLTFPVSVMNYYVVTCFFLLTICASRFCLFVCYYSVGIRWNDYIIVDLYASCVKTEKRFHIFRFFFFFSM